MTTPGGPWCECGSSNQVVWSPAFGVYVCPVCLDTRTTAELREPVAALPVRGGDYPGGNQPVAYCAPGGEEAAATALAHAGVLVTGIREHPWLSGRTVFLMGRPVELPPPGPPFMVPSPATPPGILLEYYLRQPHSLNLLPGT